MVESSLVKSERGRLKASAASLPTTTVPTPHLSSITTTQPLQLPVEKIEPIEVADPLPPAPPPEKKKVISQKVAQKVINLLLFSESFEILHQNIHK